MWISLPLPIFSRKGVAGLIPAIAAQGRGPGRQRGQEKRGPRVNLGPRWGSGWLASRAERQYYLVNCLTIFSMLAKRPEMAPSRVTTAVKAAAIAAIFSKGLAPSFQPKRS